MSSLKIRIELSRHFIKERKKFLKNNPKRLEGYKKAVKTFTSNSKSPGLKIEKLQNAKGVFTIRLNRSDRIFFVWTSENTALFIDIGKHDKYRRIYLN